MKELHHITLFLYIANRMQKLGLRCCFIIYPTLLMWNQFYIYMVILKLLETFSPQSPLLTGVSSEYLVSEFNHSKLHETASVAWL